MPGVPFNKSNLSFHFIQYKIDIHIIFVISRQDCYPFPMPGEFEFIDWLRKQQKATDFIRVPGGDDMAVLNWPNDDLLLVGVDQVLDGRHFDSKVHPPRAIGRKVMNRNLSDCAAMACLPAAAVATVALPPGATMDYAKELYLGLKDAADPFYCMIVGGDTGSWSGPLVLTVTVLGRSAGVKPITRNGARPGDGIYVSGPLGGSILGRHMTFSPRIHEARQLASFKPMNTQGVSSMIDISDGLSHDLRHLTANAELDSSAIPIHPDAVELANKDGVSALEHALYDGEDHELLFTSTLRPPLGTRIGTVMESGGIVLNGKEIPAKGWEHSIA
jgi:thiamine-monophosphate kinase